MNARIVVLPGDGIGPEIVEQAARCLSAVADRYGHKFDLNWHLVGGAALEATGDPLPEASLQAAKSADAILLGAVGGPRWDDLDAALRPEDGLARLRRELGLYANLRPVRTIPALIDCSPLRPELLTGVDLLIVRELTGGIYFGSPQYRVQTEQGWRAVDTLCYTDEEIRRVARRAFDLARGRRRRVTSVDKANVLQSSRLWRKIVMEVQIDYPDVELEHQLVDSCAIRLVKAPASFDVIVTENMFGDILSDEAAVIGGTLGLLPSASLGHSRRGLYEPIHGSAPDIAGLGQANPLGTILSVALLLRYSLGLTREADALQAAVYAAVGDGIRTPDLGRGRHVDTATMGSAVIERLAR